MNFACIAVVVGERNFEMFWGTYVKVLVQTGGTNRIPLGIAYKIDGAIAKGGQACSR